VNAIAPGLVKTDLSRNDGWILRFELNGRLQPLGRLAETGDLVRGRSVLASDASAYVTGIRLLWMVEKSRES